MLNYRLISGPAVEPIALDQAKRHLRVDFPDDDDLILALISTAREMCEEKMQRAIFNQTYELSLDQFNYGDWRSTIPTERRNPLRFSALWESMGLRLPMPRLVSVTSITFFDYTGNPQMLDPATYSVDTASQPARIVPSSNLTWPTTDYYVPGSVKVTYIAGSYGDGVTINTCPSSIKSAMLLLIGHLYTNREAVSDKNLTAVPIAVEALLGPYKFYGSAAYGC